jgi:hypothetical protein
MHAGSEDRFVAGACPCFINMESYLEASELFTLLFNKVQSMEFDTKSDITFIIYKLHKKQFCVCGKSGQQK